MPRGEDTSNHPNRRPKIIDLAHFRATREIKDVSDIAASKAKSQHNHPTSASKEPYDFVKEEQKRSISEDTDPTPYKGIPRPKQEEEGEITDYIDRSPENKTILEKMYDKFEDTMLRFKEQKDEE